MMYIRALVFSVISLSFNLLTILLSPIIGFLPALFNWREPPFPFWLFYTHDDDIYGSNTTKARVPESFYDRWKTTIWWLCRNPGYGFDAYVLGYSAVEVEYQELKINTGTFDSGKFAQQYYVIHLDKNRTRFSLRTDIPLGFGNRYIKTWLGWHPLTQSGRRMFKVDFNPFKKKD